VFFFPVLHCVLDILDTVRSRDDTGQKMDRLYSLAATARYRLLGGSTVVLSRHRIKPLVHGLCPRKAPHTWSMEAKLWTLIG
jgi:hypothetical protein